MGVKLKMMQFYQYQIILKGFLHMLMQMQVHMQVQMQVKISRNYSWRCPAIISADLRLHLHL
jgi:hypothetical protein